ncbi:hypothetical protein JCGZ_22168 [Jatropha curcas]|uniref:Uncharacterized protein n=1 Tax=Jatropha curcas TaxID=180498 RepID=A0A067L7Z8_JATCU|nr:hypothetical protein JCGZ_22168 [Jatropha curcas]
MDLGGNKPKMARKDEEEVLVEDASDAETEKLEISDEEEKEPETEAKWTPEYILAQKNREAMLNNIERGLIEEHNRELDEAIKHGKTRLATLKVKAMPYIPTSEKPKRVKHTAGRHRVHGRKSPLHPSSNRSENPIETSPAQNLRRSKRPRTESEPK